MAATTAIALVTLVITLLFGESALAGDYVTNREMVWTGAVIAVLFTTLVTVLLRSNGRVAKKLDMLSTRLWPMLDDYQKRLSTLEGSHNAIHGKVKQE